MVSLAQWYNGNVVGRINELTPCPVQLALGRVTTVSQQTTSVCNQPSKTNAASYLSGMENE